MFSVIRSLIEQAIVMFIHSLPVTRKCVPNLITDPVALIKDIRTIITNHLKVIISSHDAARVGLIQPWFYSEVKKPGLSSWKLDTLGVLLFSVAKLLYKSKCPSVCLYVCLSGLGGDIAPIFFVQFPIINEHLFCKYFVRPSVCR